MTKEEFELLFDAELAVPLGQRGFKRAGKSRYATENLALVSLIRLGGRNTARTESNLFAHTCSIPALGRGSDCHCGGKAATNVWQKRLV